MPTPLLPYLALVPYAAVACGLIVTLSLFVSLKWELQSTARRERRRVDEILARLEESAARVLPPPLSPDVVFVPVQPRAGLNVNLRVQALRLLRKGEEPAHIAAALGVPRAEVDLLVRVQQMLVEKAAGSASQRAAPGKPPEQAIPAAAGE